MSNRRCGIGAPWCARADEMFNAPGLHVLDVDHDRAGWLVVTVETDEVLTGCRVCGVVALGHGFRTFDHYRLRILLAASGTRPWRPNHA